MQVYNLKPDDSTHKSDANFQFTVKRGNEPVPGMQFKETSAELNQTGEQVTIERFLPLSTLPPGKYTLVVDAKDTHSNQTISRTADFTVKAPPESKPASPAPGR